MRYLLIPVLLYVSYTDIKTMKAEPKLLLICILASLMRHLMENEPLAFYTIPVLLTGVVMLPCCIFGSMGGADLLLSVLICMELEKYGILAVMTASILSVPCAFVCRRRGINEYPFIPFLTAGYLIWAIFVGFCV